MLNAFRRRIDPRRYNGATLVGLKGVVVKSHGGADVWRSRTRSSRRTPRSTRGVLTRIAQRIAAMPPATLAAREPLDAPATAPAADA